MKQKQRPTTTERDKLLKMLIGQGMSNSAIQKIIEPMSGKTQEEKERMAKEITAKMSSTNTPASRRR